MAKHYVTFGQDHANRINNKTIYCDMIVDDRTRHLATFDGETWRDIEEDRL